MGMNPGWTTTKPREKPRKGQGIAKFSPVLPLTPGDVVSSSCLVETPA